jgi:hypothetical protein
MNQYFACYRALARANKNTTLFGKNLFHQAEIDQWLDTIQGELFLNGCFPIYAVITGWNHKKPNPKTMRYLEC